MLLIISRCAGVFLRNTLKPSVLSSTECHSFLNRNSSSFPELHGASFVLALFYRRQLAPFGFTGHYPLASRSTPHTALRWDQRVQVVRRPSPAGYLLPPTAQMPKTERARSRRAGPLFQYVTEPGDFYGQNNLFLSTRRRSTVDRSLVATALNPSLLRRACRMAKSRNACSLLDFPEFARAVRYGVPGTPIRFSPLAAAQPLTILSCSEAPKATRSRRACRMAIGRNDCPCMFDSPKQLRMVSPELS